MLTLEDIQSAATYQQLAELLGVPQDELLPKLYDHDGYRSWLLRKKSGGYRTIASPVRFRRRIQAALKHILDAVYQAPPTVHGFVRDKSIVSNAKRHCRRKTIVNLDLVECFETITFYRVRGLFLSHPFLFPWVTANILAHACTRHGRLPAGGITSPAIANLILARLDKRLARLARKHGGEYTRYADDITFSFPYALEKLTEFAQVDVAGKYEIAQKLAAEIAAEGFASNATKFRVSTGASRKVVTGLIVNQKVNLSRVWLRELECQIYAAEKFGVLHLLEGRGDDLPELTRRMCVLRHIHGKIAFASMVRGREDWVVARLAYRLNCLHDMRTLKVPDVEHISREDRFPLGMWIVSAGKSGEDLFYCPNGNGTGFTTARGLIATAYHAIYDEGTRKPFPQIAVRRQGKPGEIFECEYVAGSFHSDLALLRLKTPMHSVTRMRFQLGSQPAHAEILKSLGYPDYFPGNELTVRTNDVTGVVPVSAISRIRVGGDIGKGMSGGPMLDRECKVVGIIHRTRDQGGIANEAISVRHLHELIQTLPQ